MRNFIVSGCVALACWTLSAANLCASGESAEATGFSMEKNDVPVTPGETFVQNDELKVKFYTSLTCAAGSGGTFFYEVYWIDNAHGAVLEDSGLLVALQGGTASVPVTSTIVAPNPNSGDTYAILYIYDEDDNLICTTASDSNFYCWFAGE